MQVGFRFEVEWWRLTPDAAEDDFGVFGRTKNGELCGCSGRRSRWIFGNDDRVFGSDFADAGLANANCDCLRGRGDSDRAASPRGIGPEQAESRRLLAKVRGNGFCNVVEDADDAENGCGIDAFAFGLVI